MIAPEESAPHQTDRIFVFVHGSYHGSWAFAKLSPLLIQHGHQVTAGDLPGHGLQTRLPRAFRQDPVDTTAMTTEISPLADVTLTDCADPVIALISQINERQPQKEIVLVGHSVGGAILNVVGEAIPEKIARLVYLSAFIPAHGKTVTDALAVDEFSTSLLPQLLVADAATVGAFRLNPRSNDPAYRALFKTVLADDVDDATWEAALHLLTPDTPAPVHTEPITTTADRWGSIPRTYITCTEDRALPFGAQHRYIRDADALAPANRTDVEELSASHSAYWSQPEQLAEILLRI